MYEGFRKIEVQTSDPEVKITGRVGGKGPALLLLHGNPLTHVTWHLVAPRLARDFTVVATDLRGYGDSEKPPGGADHSGSSEYGPLNSVVGTPTSPDCGSTVATITLSPRRKTSSRPPRVQTGSVPPPLDSCRRAPVGAKIALANQQCRISRSPPAVSSEVFECCPASAEEVDDGMLCGLH